MYGTRVGVTHNNATGKRTRTVNHVVVDEFPECQALRVQIRKCFMYIGSRKAKGRFKS
jgi:hypothetical protein